MADRVGQRFGDYRLTSFIGKGGFGDVYLGQHVTSNTLAAIKLMETRLDADDLKLFIQETSTIFRMKHPHIVQMLDFGISNDGIPFLAMAYAPNGTLRQHHPKGTRLPLATIVSYVTPIADALQFVHDQKRVHCDVKPENILLGPNNELWLSDFGISIVSRTSSLRSPSSITGTALYMAPEQFRGRPEPASDQYALAAMIYEWLSGAPPFTQGDFIQLGYQHAHEPVPPLRAKAPDISPDVEQVVMTALAKEPEQRFDSIRDFAHALEQAIPKDEPPKHNILIVPASPDISIVPGSLPANAGPPFPAPAFANAPTEQEETRPLPPDQPQEEDEDVALPPPIPFPMPPYPTRLYNQPAAPLEDKKDDGNAPPAPVQDGSAPAFIPFPTPIPPVQPRRNAGNIIQAGTGAAPPAPPYNHPRPVRKPRRGLALLVAALLIVLVTLIACGIFAYAAPGTFNALASHIIPASVGASVTITPKSQLLTESFAIQAVTGHPSSANRQVQATQLTYTTPPSTKTVNATGKKQTPATNATGTLTFYNSLSFSQTVAADTVFNLNGGVQIENDITAVIPAVNGSTFGKVTVSAHTITPGSRGNIGADVLNHTPCCGSGVTASNTSAFTGGQDSQSYTFVQQSDVSNAEALLWPGLTTQAMRGFNGEKKAGQQLVAEPNCTTNNSANPPVGAKANTTTVTVTATCTGEAYDLTGADRLAQNLLANEAARSPGAGYALTGHIVIYPPHITSIDNNGTIDLVIKTVGVWVYQFTDADKGHLALLIADKSQRSAQAILLKQAGVAAINISIANNGTALPADPAQFAITIQSVPGAPTPISSPAGIPIP